MTNDKSVAAVAAKFPSNAFEAEQKEAGARTDQFNCPTPGDWLESLPSNERKEVAMSRGLLAYFPDALALIARHSVRMNAKHNPGQPIHWAREKSTDHEDCVMRHSVSIAVDPDSRDRDGAYHVIARAWRALAALQVWAEDRGKRGMPIQ